MVSELHTTVAAEMMVRRASARGEPRDRKPEQRVDNGEQRARQQAKLRVRQCKFRTDLIERDRQDIAVELIDREYRGQHAQCVGVGFHGHCFRARQTASRTV